MIEYFKTNRIEFSYSEIGNLSRTEFTERFFNIFIHTTFKIK